MLKYPAQFQAAQEGGFVVTFRDVPEAITQGESLEDARAMAADALVTAMDFYVEERRRVRLPSARRAGEELVALPVSVSTKLALLNAVLDVGIRPVDMARRMGVRPQEVTRILNLHHATKIDTLAAAFDALALELDVQVHQRAD